MIKGLVPPLIAVAALVGLAHAGKEAGTYSENVNLHCGYLVAKHDAPAADILFVGNSQTGASIDHPYLEKLLAEDGAAPLKIEKLALVGGNVTPTRMILEDYLANRGAPRLVIYQPLAIRRLVDATAGLPVHPTVNLAFQDFDELVEVRNEAPAVYSRSWLPHWTRKGYRTEPALWLDQQVERITAALSAPRLAPYVNQCKTDLKFRLSGHWPYNSPDGPEDELHVDLNPTVLKRWHEDMDRRHLLRWSDPERNFELHQNREALAALEEAGSEIILAAYPNYEWGSQDAFAAADMAEAYGYEAIDARGIIPDSESDELDRHFRDPFHLDYLGAQMVTRAMAKELRGRVE